MIRVRATSMSAMLNVKIKELHRVASPGEEFEVTPMRFDVLNGNNRYSAIFAVKVEPTMIVEELVEDKPKRSRRKKEDGQIDQE